MSKMNGLINSHRITQDFKLSEMIKVKVFNTTFNNISVTSWQSVLLVGETGVPRENNRPDASH